MIVLSCLNYLALSCWKHESDCRVAANGSALRNPYCIVCHVLFYFLLTQEFYDSPNNLARVDVYNDGRSGVRSGPISLIRDSARGIDYIINRQLNNCTVIPRDDESFYFQTLQGDSDLVASLGTPVDLLTFAQLLQEYTYEGVTNVRGVDVDAWIGLQRSVPFQFDVGTATVRNGTWELFYTRPGWRITGDRAVTTDPVLWRINLSGDLSFTNATDNTTSSGLYTTTYDIFDFSSEEPDFDVFDVSTCFSPSEYHVLSLAVPGHVQGLNFSRLRNNLRAAIVDYAKIQPLQVGNIQVIGCRCSGVGTSCGLGGAKVY